MWSCTPQALFDTRNFGPRYNLKKRQTHLHSHLVVDSIQLYDLLTPFSNSSLARGKKLSSIDVKSVTERYMFTLWGDRERMNGSTIPSVLIIDDLSVHIAVAVRAITCTVTGW